MSITEEIKYWHFETRCLKAVEELNNNGFVAIYCSTVDEAIAYITKEAETLNTIGFGGSLTLNELDLPHILQGMNKELLITNKSGLTMEDKLSIMHKQQNSDLFLSSANAITLGGSIVLMESTGNRISSILFGPKKTILVAGRNKIAENIEDAIRRIKTYVSPPNCKRLNYKTPCTITGICSDCNSPDRSCRITTIIEKKPKTANIHVLVINSDLGL